jgi:ferric-dicitrate binding protein FerR (iron transport regulator)
MMTEKEDRAERDEKIGQLIASAGPGPTASKEAKARTYAAVHAQWQKSLQQRSEASSGRSLLRYGAIGLAATLAAAVVTLYWLHDGGPARDGGPSAMAAFSRIEGRAELLRDGEWRRLQSPDSASAVERGDSLRTGENGRLALRLDDDLSIRVNVDSELLFTDESTIELTAGTLYVDSGRGTSRPGLEVETPLGAVEHLGTQYEVHVEAMSLRVRVREGAIELTGASGTTIAEAGAQLDIGADGKTSRSVIAPNDPAWSWATKLASLPPADERSVTEAIAWAARERGLTVEYASSDAEQRWRGERISGLPADLNPSETLDVIGQIAGLEYEVRATRLVVTN